MAEEEQRVVDAEWLQEREPLGGLPAAQLRVTLLAAGFVIGASGASVRELSQKTRTRIQSWTEKPPTTRARYESGGGSGNDRKRTFRCSTKRRSDDRKRKKKRSNEPDARVPRARRPGGCLARRRDHPRPWRSTTLCAKGSAGASSCAARRECATSTFRTSRRRKPPRSRASVVRTRPRGSRRRGKAMGETAAARAPRRDRCSACPRVRTPRWLRRRRRRRRRRAARWRAPTRVQTARSARSATRRASASRPISVPVRDRTRTAQRTPGVFPGASPNANAYARGTPPSVAPTFRTGSPRGFTGGTGGSRGLNGSFDRARSGGGDDGWSDPSTPAFARGGRTRPSRDEPPPRGGRFVFVLAVQ